MAMAFFFLVGGFGSLPFGFLFHRHNFHWSVKGTSGGTLFWGGGGGSGGASGFADPF